jgi:hypothetical protein
MVAAFNWVTWFLEIFYYFTIKAIYALGESSNKTRKI